MTEPDSAPNGERTDSLLDTALPAALLVAVASWLPAGVLLLGYAVRVIRAELRGGDDLPPVTDVRGLARTGLSAGAVVVAYQLPALLVVAGAFALAASSVDSGQFGVTVTPPLTEPVTLAHYYLTAPGVAFGTVAAFVLAGVALCLTSYAGAFGLVTFARTDRLASAFDGDVLSAGVRSSSFYRAFLLACILGFVGSALVWLVALVPLVGAFAAAFVELFFLVGALRVLAAGYDERFLRASPSVVTTAAPLTSPERDAARAR